MENKIAPKAMYPYTYGDLLTQEEANKRIRKHGLKIASACTFLVFNLPHTANAVEPLDNALAGSIVDKSPVKQPNTPVSPFINFQAPQSPTGKKINTALFIASTGVICANAYWTKSPALIVACLSITSNAMEAALRTANPAL